MTYRLASLMDKGVAPNTAAAVTKIFATESNSKCACPSSDNLRQMAG